MMPHTTLPPLTAPQMEVREEGMHRPASLAKFVRIELIEATGRGEKKLHFENLMKVNRVD